MTRTTNFISATNSSLPPDTAAEPPFSARAESDFIIILAALLCTIITVVGLISMARCAWLRRRGWAAGQPSANRGLKNKVMRSLPKFTYDSASGKVFGECAICLAEYDDGDEIRSLPQCGHCFHARCVDTWLVSHSSCPSCRQILVASRCRKCAAGFEVKAREDSVIANLSL